jgi:hypothetical protein
MPAQFMPNGMVANHSIAGSLSFQYCGEAMNALDGALRSGLEAGEVRHDLAGREDLDPEPPAARLLDHFRQSLGGALQHVEGRGPSGGHPPLDLRLCDDVGSVDDGGRSDGRHRPPAFAMNLRRSIITLLLHATNWW